jgi:Predicted amidophosphoribosyltransferases
VYFLHTKIQPVVSRAIEITATKHIKVLAIGQYAPPLKSLILAKSRGYKPMSVLLGNLVWQMSLVRNIPCDIITSIPLHWTRHAWRGYNPAHEIARVIADHKKVPLLNLLKRKKRTPFYLRYRCQSGNIILMKPFR